ncbi:retrotransposon protein, putative, ty1-copia subclass [Tanacetum coccineum]
MAEGEIDNLTMEQYLALTRGNQAPGVVKPEIGGNVNFEIKSQFMRELREDTFSGNKNDDAHEHVERVLDIVGLFNIPGVTHDAVMLRVLPTIVPRSEDDQEINEPQIDINPIRKSSRTRRAPDRMCLYIGAEEHELGDLASGSYVAILILYVDDILLMGNNIPMLQDVKSYLGRSFAMKDLGEAAYILGIKIYHDSKSQGASTPAEKQCMQNIPYASAIGSIMYAVICTRPYVAFAQNITSRFQQNPGEEHWTAVKNILKYLSNTKDMFLVYGGNMERELRVSCYTDAGYLTDADNLKSQTGYVFILNGGAVDWKSTKQTIAIAKDDGVTKGAIHFRAKVHYLRKTIKMFDERVEKI